MLAGKRSRRLAHVSLAGLLALAACAGGDDDAGPPPPTPRTETTGAPASTSVATTEVATTVPSTVPAETTAPSVAPSTAPPTTPALDPVDGPAVLADVLTCTPAWAERAADEITFTRGRDLFAYQPDTGEFRCLAQLDREPESLDWSPDGRTLLVDADLLVDANGSRPSGFAPGTEGMRWSKPNGRALIAPSDDGTQLVHIDIDDPSSARDVGALAETWAADYHPSGEAIVSAGVDADGRRGLFLADNDGGQLTQLVTLDDPADRITDVSFGHDARWVNFVHDHAGGDENGAVAHVHRFDLVGVFVTDLSTPPAVPVGLVTSRQADGTVAYRVGVSTAHAWAEVAGGAEPVRAIDVSDHAVEPVGFVDGGSLVDVVRPIATPGATGELRLAAADGAEVTVLARGIGGAAVRVVPFPTWEAPPLGVILQAVG